MINTISKREQYGLIFSKIETSSGRIRSLVTQKIPGVDYSILTFMHSIDAHECVAFIDDLDRSIRNKRNIDERFLSDGVEYMNVLYQYPDVNLDDILIIPMADMKGLLEEWLEYIRND